MLSNLKTSRNGCLAGFNLINSWKKDSKILKTDLRMSRKYLHWFLARFLSSQLVGRSRKCHVSLHSAVPPNPIIEIFSIVSIHSLFRQQFTTDSEMAVPTCGTGPPPDMPHVPWDPHPVFLRLRHFGASLTWNLITAALWVHCQSVLCFIYLPIAAESPCIIFSRTISTIYLWGNQVNRFEGFRQGVATHESVKTNQSSSFYQ